MTSVANDLHCGMDLHSNNTFIAVTDEHDRAVLERRVPNELATVLRTIEPWRERISGIAVESTFNWYWLVDGLMDADYRVHLTNPAAAKQYEGLKFTDDRHDARWLAHMLRLGILPTGYIYPKKERAVRDLLRKRIRFVQQRTATFLSVHNLLARNTGQSVKGNELRNLLPDDVGRYVSDPDRALAIALTLKVAHYIDLQAAKLDRVLVQRARLKRDFRVLKTIPGVGDTLGMTIMYETGEIRRFPSVGDYASYCRCVPTDRRSNNKSKGKGNPRNGNPYLSWAFSEAAFFARRFCQQARRFYDRKLSSSGSEKLATRSLAAKLARASYFMLRDQVPFDVKLLFGS